MYIKPKIESEQFYWDKQIERHQTGKKIRNLARKINYKPYTRLAKELGVSNKTIWALANGLATASKELTDRLEELLNEQKLR